MEKKLNKRFLNSLIFNLIETILIFLVGRLIGAPTKSLIIVMLTFLISKGALGGTLHFKDWYRCLLWSLLILFSLFLLSKVDLTVSILFTIFSAFIMTGRSNIDDMYLWGGNKLNGSVFDWVKFNQNNEQLLDYEKKLKETDNRKYIIFEYRFREFKSYSEIANLMEIDIQRISDEIKIMSHFIEYSIRLGGE